ncbi:MAG TPA: hypothetical protein VF193_14185 [Steroidobacter sp.]
MATVNLSKSKDHKRFVSHFAAEWREVVFDATQKALAQNDVAELIDVHAGETVLRVDAQVLSADANAGTFDVGDGADADGYLDGIDAQQVGYNAMSPILAEGTPNSIAGYTAAGKFYAADDTIDLVALGVNGLTTAKIVLRALVVPASRAKAA